MSLSWDTVRLLLSINLILGVSRLHQHYAFLAPLRPLLLLVALTILYIFLNPRSIAWKGVLETWPAKVILGLALLACLSAPFGLSLGNSARYILQNYSKVIVVTLLVIAATRNVRDLATFVWAYVVACAGIAWLAIFSFGLARGPVGHAYRLQALHTFDANDLSCILLAGFPLTVIMLHCSKGLRKWASGAILIAIGVTFARAGSRGGFLGLLAAGTYLLFGLRGVSPMKRVAFAAAAVGALLIGAPEGYWQQMKTIVNPKEDYNWSAQDGRKELAKRGLGYMLDYPVFGLGISNYTRAEGVISEKAQQHVPGTGIKWVTAHNSYILAGAELGIPGLILWSFLVIGGIAATIRLQRRLPARWARGDPEERFLYFTAVYMPVSLVGFAVSSFFVSFTYSEPLYFVAAIMAGLFFTVRARLQREPLGAAPGVRRRPTATPTPSPAGMAAPPWS